VPDIEDNNGVMCTSHGWKLDVEQMRYTDPPDLWDQEEFQLEGGPAGSVELWEDHRDEPWLVGDSVDQRATLADGEFVVTYLSHASLLVRGGDSVLAMDPWLLGPAFGRGWWLAHQPPPDAVARVAASSALYISHSHPDHLSLPTLRAVHRLNPDLPILVGKLAKPVWTREASAIGFSDIRVLPLGAWHAIPPSPRGAGRSGTGCFELMILPDGLLGALDTMVLVRYKGHLVVNLVDCAMPNGMALPRTADVVLSDFASGASGFPACFSEMHGWSKCLQLADHKRKAFLGKMVRQVSQGDSCHIHANSCSVNATSCYDRSPYARRDSLSPLPAISANPIRATTR